MVLKSKFSEGFTQIFAENHNNNMMHDLWWERGICGLL